MKLHAVIFLWLLAALSRAVPVPVKSFAVPLNRNVAPVAWEAFAGAPISITGTLPAGQDFTGLTAIRAELHLTQNNSETPLAVSDDLQSLPAASTVTLTFTSAKMNRAAGKYYIGIYATYTGDRVEIFRVAELRLSEGGSSQLTPPAPAPALYATTGDLDDLESAAMLEQASRLKEIVSGSGYELTSMTRDADSVITTAVVKWPDGTAGVFTTVTKNTTFLSIDAYTITYSGSPARTITQPLVTRDANGGTTAKPALTIAP